jgi:hypothetical protein
MGETADAAATDTDDPTRPRFRGCVICYSAEMVAYGVRKLRR